MIDAHGLDPDIAVLIRATLPLSNKAASIRLAVFDGVSDLAADVLAAMLGRIRLTR
jgi:hypothetical protein